MSKIPPLTPETSVQYVKGIGPKRADILGEQGVFTVKDLMHYYPRRYIDRSHVEQIQSLKPGQEVTVVGTVLATELRRGRRSRFIVSIGDGSGLMQCVWFQGLSWVSRVFKKGETVAFSGKVTVYRGPQLIHPEYDKLSEEGEQDPLHTGGIIPLYPSGENLRHAGLDGRGFRRILSVVINSALKHVHEILPQELLRRCDLMPLSESLQHIHFPGSWEAFARAQYRLKFEELFFIQLRLLKKVLKIQKD